MNKEDKHIDNLFKEKLDGRSFDGPPADFLADLDQRLDAKPVVSKSWVWMIFLNFFIIGLFIANANIDSSTSKTTKVTAQLEEKEQSVEKQDSFKSENGQTENASINTEANAETTNTTKTARFSNTAVKSDPSRTSQVEKNQDKNNITGTKSQNDIAAEAETTEQSDNKKRKSSGSIKSSINKDASSDSKGSNTADSYQVSKKTANSGGINTTADQKDNSASKDKAEAKKPTSKKDITSINGSESLSSYVSYSEIYAPQFEEVERKITTNDFPEFPSRFNDLVAEDNNKPTEKGPKKENDIDKRMFEIQLQGGAAQWSFKTLGTNANYVNQIDEAGTPKWTPSFGLGFNVNFNNISIGTGIDYAKFKTENLFEFSEISTYDSTYIGGYNENVTYDSLGNPIDTTYTPYYDSTTVTDTSYNSNLITNEYEWIQIPLHFGYRFNLNKWAIIPRVGANIGIGIRQTSGQYPNEAYDNLQTIDPVKWNLNLLTSLEVRRDFGNWHAFGKFNYQRNLTPTIDNALFERKFNGIGFNFGVGYSF